MPAQGSWVEHWLGRYCTPGKHLFRPLRTDVVICETCSKEELSSGETCLICGIPGEHEVVLRPTNDALSAPARGRLCGPCFDEFKTRVVIDGLELAHAI